MSTGRPKRCTGITQRVRGVSAASTASVVSRAVSGSTSTMRGVAPTVRHRLGGGDEAVGGNDDLVAGADAEASQRQLERGGPRGDADRVLDLAVGGEVLLEALEYRPEGEGGVAATRSTTSISSANSSGSAASRRMKGTRVPVVAARGNGARASVAVLTSLLLSGCCRQAVLGAGQARSRRFQFEKEGRGLAAGTHAELREGGREVALDRALREEELLGDLGVGESPGDVGQDLALTMGEGRSLDAGAHLARDHRLAAGDGADRHRQGRLELGIEDDRVGAGIECAADPGAGRFR